MTTKTWNVYINRLESVLSEICVSNADGAPITPDDGFKLWKELTISLRESKNTLFLIGNGASASMASHFSTDLIKNAHVAAHVFSDSALITAISNDIGYHQVYAAPLLQCTKAGDMIIAISSSGKSPNILSAANLAEKLQLSLVTLTGMNSNNPLRGKGVLNFYISANDYSMVETSHAAILHHWMDSVKI